MPSLLSVLITAALAAPMTPDAVAQEEPAASTPETPAVDKTEGDATEAAPDVDKTAEPAVAKEEAAPEVEKTAAPAVEKTEPAPAPVTKPVAVAEEPAPAPKKKNKKTPTEFSLKGLYTVWGLTQQNFMLGTDHPLDDAAYTVQMLRLTAEAKRPTYGVLARMDLAQGWWGVDNEPNATATAGVDADGNPTTGSAYNADVMFGNKGTHYGLHVDLAYGYVNLPTSFPLQVRLGRQYFGVGHKLILDMDYDGIQVEAKPTDGLTVQAWWAKVGEGLGARTLPRGLVMSDKGQWADADLFSLVGNIEPNENHDIELYAIYYMDRSAQDDWSVIPNDLGTFRSRHTPNISSAFAAGVAADGKFDVGKGLLYSVEAAVLSGRDDVDNTNYAGGILDINNGTLFGYNSYLTLDQKFDGGVPMKIGAMFGMGSGDADKTGGAGNLSRIQTMGFFPLTFVWEDSVMPDIEGITPQGLGSPVSRGYRELENTTAIQGRYAITPAKGFTLDASYTYLLATTPVQAFDAAGAPTGEGASDLGQEIDLRAKWVLPAKKDEGAGGPILIAMGGVFLPGTAAENLMVGGADAEGIPWELKTVATFKF
ncbi:MAG: hypothetical protein KC912_19330 [Proteobacteria bacterium]|nr:hypothetical protein [Pseudomonadota bacterium]